MSQTPPTLPTNPFSTFGLAPTANVSSYDNAELREMGKMVYHFAQQKSSCLLPILNDVGEVQAPFIQQDRFGSFEWSVRSNEVGDTPMTKHTNDTRAAASVNLHAGHSMDRDIVKQTRYDVPSNVQMELGYSLGRSIDRLIMAGLFRPVIKYTSTAASAFQGIPVPSTENLPPSSKSFFLNGNGSQLAGWTPNNIDSLIEDFEDADWDLDDLYVIMPPDLRRALKDNSDFRDAENNQSFHGNENYKIIRWLGVNFVKISSKIRLPQAISPVTQPVATGGRYAKGVATGQALSAKVTNEAERKVTIAFSPKALKFRSTGRGGVFSAYAPRVDKQWAPQLYTRAAYACLRKDDTGVRLITYA